MNPVRYWPGYCFADKSINRKDLHVTDKSLSQEEIQAIANEISRYLSRHQFAADTIEGICHWWISKQRIEEEQRRVLAALDYLLKNQKISSRQLPDGSLLYSAVDIGEQPDIGKQMGKH